jgi:hypothetical protein
LIVEVTERHLNIQSAFKNQQPSGARQTAAGSPEGEAEGLVNHQSEIKPLTDEFLVCATVFFAAKMRKIRNQVKFSGLLSSVFKSSV